MKSSSTKLLTETKHFETPSGSLIAIPLSKSPILFSDILNVLREKIPEKIPSKLYVIILLRIRDDRIFYKAFLSNGKFLKQSEHILNLIYLTMEELEQNVRSVEQAQVELPLKLENLL